MFQPLPSTSFRNRFLYLLRPPLFCIGEFYALDGLRNQRMPIGVSKASSKMLGMVASCLHHTLWFDLFGGEQGQKSIRSLGYCENESDARLGMESYGQEIK